MANIKQIAQALVILSFKDMKDVAKVLKEEYDIEPKQETEKNLRSIPEILKTCDNR